MTQLESVHLIIPRNPERPRIVFRIRQQYKDFLNQAITCRDAYETRWRKQFRSRRWTELHDALRNMIEQQMAGKMPIFLSGGRARDLKGQPIMKRERFV